jgi:cysteine synthase A
MKIFSNVLETIGQTPIVKINSLNSDNVFVKLEYFNPASSIKDRAAYNILKSALDRGDINKETVIIEATSGNMGVALAFVCAILNLKFIAVMPSNMSIERRKLIKAYGAEIVLTEPKLGMQGAVEKAMELKMELNGFIPSQFENIYNPIAHYNSTAAEIYNDTNGNVGMVVSGIGTGGTITGVGKYLKEKMNVKIIGVEPLSSPLLTKNISNSHKIQGIGANFIPKILELSIIDKIVTVSDDEAIKYAKELAFLEGIFVGISSGAALAGAINYIKENNIKDIMVVVIFPDTGERYLSTELAYE